MIKEIKLTDTIFFETGPEVQDDLNRLLESGKFIGKFEEGIPDNEVEGLTWGLFGTWENDVDMLYVQAKYKDKTWAIRGKPGLIFPRMVDRCFGMDESDDRVCCAMSVKLYEEIKDELE